MNKAAKLIAIVVFLSLFTISAFASNGVFVGETFNDGFLSSCPNCPQIVAGKHGSALKFDGIDDIISIPNDASMNFGTGNFTLSAWVMTTSATNGAIIETSTGADIYTAMKALRIENSGKNIGFYVRSSGGNPDLSVNVNLNDGKWHHVAGTYAANQRKLHFDGVLVGNDTTSIGNTDTASPWIIGSALDGTVDLTGSVDEVRIYNRALTQQEISDDMNSTHPISRPAASYSFEKIENNKVFDTHTIVKGKYGAGVSFDGINDYVELGTGATFDITSAITLEAWIKTSVLHDGAIIVKDDAAGKRSYLLHTGTSGYIRMQVLGTTGGELDWTSTEWADGNWHHLAGTYDGANTRIYFDGVEKASEASTGSISVSTTNLRIGNRDAVTDDVYFNGGMDEIRMYNRALTSQEIKESYQNNKVYPNNVLYLSSDNASKATPFDFSVSVNPAMSRATQTTVTVALVNGTSQNVALSHSGCPPSATCSFSPTSGNPTFTSNLTVATTNATPAGYYNITITGIWGETTRSAVYVFNFTDSQPLAGIVANPMSGTAPLTVNFLGLVGYGDSPFTYFWDFKDGTNSTQRHPTHTFNAAGTYNVAFAVTDYDGDSSTSSVLITVNASVCTRAKPNVTISPSLQSGTAGSTLSYTVTIANGDPSSCGASLFNLTAAIPAGWNSSFANSSLTVNPNSNRSTTFSLTSHPNATAGDYDFNVSATNTNNTAFSGTASGTYRVLQGVVTYYSDNFESGLGWTTTGFWHLTARRSNSPTHSLWYGNESSGTYQTGSSRNFGSVTSPQIDLRTATNPRLTFNSYWDTELGTAWDTKKVFVSRDGGAWTQVLQVSANPRIWTQQTVDLTSYAGSVINIQFAFDTVDGLYNNYEGWFIDDVQVKTVNNSFDFSMSANPPNTTVTQARSAQINVVVALVSGASQTVSLSHSGCPPSATCSFSPASGNTTYSSNLTVSTANSTPAGSYNITITGSGGNLTRSIKYPVNVVDSSVFATAKANSTSGTAPLTVNFSGGVLGANTPFTFFWDFKDGTNSTQQHPQHTFTSAGTYNVTFRATDYDGDSSTSSVLITVNASVCTRAKPNVTISPSLQSGTAGSTLGYTVTVNNRDSSSCGASAFNLSSAIPQGWNSSFANNSLNVNPNSNRSTTFSLRSHPNATAGDYSFNVTATNTNNASFFGKGSATYRVTAQATVYFSDNFETGQAWNTSGFWHVTTRRSNSPTHSLWYGNESSGTYQTGSSRNFGNATSPQIDLRTATNPRLTFNNYWNTESGATWDTKKVFVSRDGAWTQVLQVSANPGIWTQQTVDLTGYAGSVISIRFAFDTVDGIANNYEGWFVDDVQVSE